MFTYNYALSDFPNSKVNLNNLTLEIQKSSIIIALDHINLNNNIVEIIFKSEISVNDKSTLDNIVATHDSTQKTANVIDVNVIAENKKYVDSGDVLNDLYVSESWVVDVPADVSVYEQTFSKPYPISLLAADLKTTTSMIGDTLCALIAPDTIVGAITSSALIGDTSINVSATVVENLKVGRSLTLDGIKNHVVIGVDTVNNIITIETPLEKDFNPGTYVMMNIHIIKNMYIHAEQNLQIGRSINTGQRIPANTIIKIRYWNDTLTAKKFAFFVEYLY